MTRFARVRGTTSGNYARFRRQLRRARLQARLTQVEAGQRLGRPQSFIAKIESGVRRIDAVELRTLAKAYRVPVSFFYRW